MCATSSAIFGKSSIGWLESSGMAHFVGFITVSFSGNGIDGIAFVDK